MVLFLQKTFSSRYLLTCVFDLNLQKKIAKFYSTDSLPVYYPMPGKYRCSECEYSARSDWFVRRHLILIHRTSGFVEIQSELESAPYVLPLVFNTLDQQRPTNQKSVDFTKYCIKHHSS